MTDNEIIKALEWWLTVGHNTGSITLSKQDIFAINDLINRQKAEIERLKTENKDISEQFRILDVECERLEKANEKQKAEIERLQKDSKRLKKVQMQLDDAMKMYSIIKAEAFKEFAERLKAKNKKPECPWEDYSICESDIDETYEELVGVEK